MIEPRPSRHSRWNSGGSGCCAAGVGYLLGAQVSGRGGDELGRLCRVSCIGAREHRGGRQLGEWHTHSESTYWLQRRSSYGASIARLHIQFGVNQYSGVHCHSALGRACSASLSTVCCVQIKFGLNPRVSVQITTAISGCTLHVCTSAVWPPLDISTHASPRPSMVCKNMGTV